MRAVIATLLVTLVSITGCASISDEVYEGGARMEVLEEGRPVPANYVEVGEVRASRRFENLREDRRQVIDELKRNAYRQGADAIGQIVIHRSTYDLYAQTPRHVQLDAVARTYCKRQR